MSDLSDNLLRDLIEGQGKIEGRIGELTTGVHTLQQQSELIFDRLNRPEEFCSAYKNLHHRIERLEVRKTGPVYKPSTVRPAIAGTAAASMMVAVFEAIRYWIETRIMK